MLKTMLFALLIGISSGFEYSPQQIAEMEAGLERWRQIAESVHELSIEEAIPQLGQGLRKTSMESIYPYGDRQGTFKILKDTILTIPGHATWHGEQIKQLTDAEIEGRPTGKHSLQRWWYYETLQQLPSPETVKVLGEFLFDERDPWKHLPTDDGGRWHPNSLYAVRALNKLGIRNAPVKREHWDPADLRTWQLWYEQIRAGTRTFSFEGDDAIYSLSGPVRTALDPGDILSESRRSPAAGTGAAAEAKPESSKVPLIAALSLALLSLILAARRAMLNRPA